MLSLFITLFVCFVYRELLNCEATLAAIYCRSSLLTLYSSTTSTLSFPTYFNFLAQHNFSQPSVEGLCTTTCPSLSPSPQTCLRSNSLSTPYNLFYSNQTIVEKGLESWLAEHPDKTMSLVVKLNEEVTQVAGGIGQSQFPIPEGRDSSDVYCPRAAFMITSGVELKSGSSSG